MYNEQEFRNRFDQLLQNPNDQQARDDFFNYIRGMVGGNNQAYARSSFSNFSSYGYGRSDDLIGEKKALEEQRKELEEELQELLDNGYDEASEEVRELREELEKVCEAQRKVNLEINKVGKMAAWGDHISASANRFTGTLGNIISSIQRMYGEVNKLVEPWAKADQAASNYAKTIATSRAGREALRAQTISNVYDNKLAADLDLSSEEVIEAQLDYSKGIGRNAKISNEGQAALGAMTKVYGGAAKELSVLFEKFGVGPVDTGKHLGKMFAEASKSGLSLEKYAENVNKGLRLAQKYTFSGGLKGMEAMAKRATELHMDMQQIETLANKVGTIEGSITTAAKLQVLGGPFSSMADPMGMFSEAWGDMEGLEKRMEEFTATMGHFNKQTGEVEISAFNKQRLRAYAEATGQDYAQVLEQTQQQAKLGEVNSQIARSANASQWDDATKELFRNTATFENGKAGVSINGEFRSIDELSSKELEQLRLETQSESEDIKDIASMLRDYFQVESSRKKAQDAQRAKWTEDTGVGNGMKGLNDKIAHSNFLLGMINAGIIAMSIGNIFGGFGNLIGRRGLGGLFRGGKGAIGRLGGKIFGRGGGRAANAMSRGASGAMGGLNRMSTGAVQKFGSLGANLSAKGGRIGKLGEKMFNVAAKGEGKLVARQAARTAATQAASRTAAQTASGIAQQSVRSRLMTSGVGKALGRANIARQGITNSLNKAAGKAFGKGATKLIAKAGPKMLKAGGIMGAAGIVGELATDALVSKGKIKKGGAGHTALHVGSKMAQYAGMGAMFGPVGAAIGAGVGAIVGGVQMAKVKREMALDNKLKAKGLERKGDYGARRLRKIDEALSTGKISKSLRRKMEREGDTALLEEIDKVGEKKQKEKEEKREKRRKNVLEFISAIKPGGGGPGNKLNNAKFDVKVAHFSGKAFNGGNNIQENTANSGEEGNVEEKNGNSLLSNPILKHSPLGMLSKLFSKDSSEDNKGGIGSTILSNPLVKYSPIGIAAKLFSKGSSENNEVAEGNEGGAVGSILSNPFVEYSPLGIMAKLFGKNTPVKNKNEIEISALEKFKQSKLGELGGLGVEPNKNIGPGEVKPVNVEPVKEISINGGKPENGNSASLQELKRSEENDFKSTEPRQVKIEPVDININGTLRLEGNTGSGENIDILAEIKKDPRLLSELTEMIAKQLNKAQFGGYKVTRTGGNNLPTT